MRTLKRGDVLGELALLQEGRRSASVRAVRDTWLVTLGRGDFEALMRTSPDFALALTRNLGGQLAASGAAAPDPTPPDVIAVVGIHDAAWAPEIADTLERELARYGTVARLGYDADRPIHDFPLALDKAEHAHDRVLLVGAATAPGEPWTDFCLREADATVAVTHGAPALGWLEQRTTLKGCELLVTAGEVTAGVIDGTGAARGAGRARRRGRAGARAGRDRAAARGPLDRARALRRRRARLRPPRRARRAAGAGHPDRPLRGREHGLDRVGDRRHGRHDRRPARDLHPLLRQARTRAATTRCPPTR